MNHFECRRARLRQEYAWLYPELVSGIWMSAGRAARFVRAAGKGPRGGARDVRVLPDIHFEFRGGRRRTRQDLSGAWTPRTELLAS